MENTCLILPYTVYRGIRLHSLVKICPRVGRLSYFYLEYIRPQLPETGDKAVHIYLPDTICILVYLCGLTSSDKKPLNKLYLVRHKTAHISYV
jgi:hypothetical protein